MADDGRVRLLKALKVSYWKQFEHGMLSREAVQALTNLADTAMDDEDRYKVNYRKTPDIIPPPPHNHIKRGLSTCKPKPIPTTIFRAQCSCYEYKKIHIHKLQLQELYYSTFTLHVILKITLQYLAQDNQLIITSPFLSYLAVIMRSC